MKKRISLIIIFVFLSGCASTKITDSALQKRTMTIGDFGAFVLYRSETEGLTIGEAELIKDKD